MTEERRYDEAEIAEILDRAASVEPTAQTAPSTGGLTLSELQEIGREVGIAPERIASAARALATRPDAEPAPRLLGTPAGVSRTAPLSRAPDDAEWERIVAMVRATFGATGTVESLGSLRTWRNGNLQVHVEPDGEGYRLRMRTRKGDAPALTLAGGAMSLMGVGLATATALTWDPANPKPLVAAALVGLLGLGQLAWVRLTLPSWADERARQMDELAARIPELLDG